MRNNGPVTARRLRPLPRLCAVVFVATAALTMSSCDSGHTFDDVQVKIFSTGDGTAAVSIAAKAPDDRPFDERAFATAVMDALAIGRVVGPSAEPIDPYSTGPSFDLADVDREQLQIAIRAVLDAVADAGYDADASTFVSLCTSVRSGRATGADVTIVHLDTCAIWDSTAATERGDDDATATLTFASRSTPARSSSIYVAVLVLAGLAGAVMSNRSRRALRRTIGFAMAVVSMAVSAGVSLIAFVWAIRLNDPWPDTGQVFDRDLAGGSLALAIATVIAGVAIPGAVLWVGRVLSRRRLPE